MALTIEMMDILIAEYFFDPENLGYRKYGYIEINEQGESIFYMPQILFLINESRNERIIIRNEFGEHQAYKRRNLPSRINKIFENIPGAPNRVTIMDVLITFQRLIAKNPTIEVAGLVITE